MLAGSVFQESYMQSMQKFINAQGLQNSVQFVPQLSRQQLSGFSSFTMHACSRRFTQKHSALLPRSHGQRQHRQ